MTDSEHTDDSLKDDGTMRSPEEGPSPHEWTEDEMRKAKPYPLPTVAPEQVSGVQSRPGPGKLGTSEGGRPEEM
jgi:hypothetical protein